ncbi:DUF559 domain-containing protein [Qipengyuania marisflavi]|nr:DUF559 domain-containing protein [Qipengyuania marisflavi]
MADPHDLLWQHLQGSPRGLKFLRDFAEDGVTLQFYCAEAHLAAEITDDPFKQADTDLREAWLEQHRVDVMQIPPSHVLRNASEVSDAILSIATGRVERFADAASGKSAK